MPEWTIVDFIHRGPWWTNRGSFLFPSVHCCMRIQTTDRHTASQHLPRITFVDCPDQRLRLILSQRCV